MMQVVFRGGKALVEEVPAPGLEAGQVLVRVAWSCVSPGTELESAASTGAFKILERFRRNPAKVRKALRILRDRGPQGLRAIA